MKILAIETSCDETAASVVEKTNGDIKILSNIVSSQIDLHKKFGGVFPEIASRAHVEQILPVIREALAKADSISHIADSKNYKPSAISHKLASIDAIAVTSGPGLIGSLLVGVNTAKTLAFANNKPIIPINHWLGHIYSCFTGNVILNGSEESQFTGDPSAAPQDDNLTIPQFPLLALIVSGGHTGLVYMKSHTEYETIGQTLDDAAGEAFDKVSKILGLGYPGGPAISEAAARYVILNDSEESHGILRNAQDDIPNIKFPRSMLDRDDFNFSFSGLKTAVLYKVKELTICHKLSAISSAVAFEFQQTVIDILIGKTLKAAEKYQPKSILLCGGVSANYELREQMTKAVLSFSTGRRQDRESRSPMSSATRLEDDEVTFHVPPLPLTGDNAAMIGLAAAYQIANGIKPTTFDKINADSNLKL